MPLPLLSCCISGLGPEGLLHNHTILVWSPSNLLWVTLASRGISASKNLQQETQWPKCCLYEMPYVAAPVRETGNVIVRTLLYEQLPSDAPTRTRIFLGSQVTGFSRDPFCCSNGSYVPFLRGQADRGYAAEAFFGGEGGAWYEKGVTLRGLRSSEKKEILRKLTVL
jgi:hypothetical protein